MSHRLIGALTIVSMLCLAGGATYSQCNVLTDNRNITYTVDGQCAPTTVTQFTIEYEFLSAQTPTDISIRFEWNDPGANTDEYSSGDTEFVVSGGDTRFQAVGTFSYPANDECAFFPTAFLLINGAVCVSSEEEKTAISWDADDDFGGMLAITPSEYEVCHGDAIIGAQFTDNTTFNCNIDVEPDNPNRLARHVQFVYGDVATHNPASTILDLSLEDSGTQPLTNGTGAIAAPIGPRGTGGTQITAAYFGPVEVVLFPADAPNAATFLMNAPANVANAIGNTFEITMYNWNICNPYNDDENNPNYNDAISITANITIVAAPSPNFVTREDNASGLITTEFCIGEVVYFDNLTGGGGLGYLWEYFDGPSDTDPLLANSTATNPTNIFQTGGQKLIRLTATNPTAQSACAVSVDLLINITPTLIAGIRATDLSDMDITPHFCQDASMSQSFDVRFFDNSLGTPTANTGIRWEFYDAQGNLESSLPAGAGFITGVASVNPPDQGYTMPGNYQVRILTEDGITGCQTEESIFVRIYNDPVAEFTATVVCEGSDTHFEDASSLMTINGESIVTYEWDFNYDGVTFSKDPAFDGMTSFDRNMGGASTYKVALRVVTDQNSCEHVFDQDVFVRPMPISTFTLDQTSGCSVLPIEFTNTGHASQPAIVTEYIWQIDPEQDGIFINEFVQDPTLAAFTTVFTRDFSNTSLVDQMVDVRLVTENEFGCMVIGPIQTITIFPAAQSGFTDLNYDPFGENCGSASVDFEVDAVTQGLGPSSYTWRIEDENGLVQPDVVLPPTNTTFSFDFENPSTTEVKDFDVTLIPSFVSCTNDSTRTIRVNPVPAALFEVDTLLLDCQNMTLQMSAQQLGLAEYAWEILVNDVITFSSNVIGDTFDHDFTRPAPGAPDLSVDIRLQTTNFANCQSIVEQISIIVPTQDEINADFIVTPLTQTLPDRTVTIINNTSPGPWTYLWDFGDGQTSIDPNITTHMYDTYGDYIITLTVQSSFCVEESVQMITINPIPPIVDFEYTPESGCVPLQVQFTNLSQFADADSYVWNFGDNSGGSNEVNPRHVYGTPGVYTVSLTASNVGGAVIEVKPEIIEVFDFPIATFNINPAIVNLPNPVYTNNTSFGATSFLWDFGDGTTSTEFEPIHVYEDINVDAQGNSIGYDISLIAYNENGCSDTLSVVNSVIVQRSQRILVANAFSPSLIGPSADGSLSGGGSGSVNDIFLPLFDSDRVTSFQMLIFNKWGELLFESTNKLSGWDGYYRGKLVPQDVYVYRLTVEFVTGDQETRVGDVTLIR